MNNGSGKTENGYSGIYRFAEIPVRIDSLYPDVHTLCEKYASTEEPLYEIAADAESIAAERERSAKEDLYEGHAVREYSDGYLETLSVYRKMAERFLDSGLLLFHGSALAVDGKAYLFTAKSGTGKSTHARLWREYLGERVVMVNDDKPLLKPGKNGTTVYGTPWDGKHKLSTDIGVPVKAICLLSRGKENRIERITPGEAYPVLLGQTYRPQNAALLAKVLGGVDRIMKTTEFYRLSCNMEPEAARISYEGMKG